MQSLSIIIPTLNEEVYLPKLLQSIVDQNYTSPYEVIVVDGGSEDKTRKEALKFKGVIPNLSFFSHTRGTARQRNYGASKAKFDSLIFIDSDMMMPSDFLQKISRHFDTKGNFIASPLMLPYDGTLIDTIFAIFGNLYFTLVQWTNPITSGMCIVTTRQVHEAISGFDETLRVAEDVDYGLRAFRAGYKYHILYNTVARSSTRRLQKIGRVKLGLLWVKWHKVTSKHGAASLQDEAGYEFGEYGK